MRSIIPLSHQLPDRSCTLHLELLLRDEVVQWLQVHDRALRAILLGDEKNLADELLSLAGHRLHYTASAPPWQSSALSPPQQVSDLGVFPAGIQRLVPGGNLPLSEVSMGRMTGASSSRRKTAVDLLLA